FDGKFTILIGIDLYWIDPRLRWNSSEHENINCIFVELNEIWQPEIRFTFAVSAVSDLLPTSPIRVCSNGMVHVIDYHHVSRNAKFDTRDYPFDTQKIIVAFGQMTVSIDDVIMEVSESSKKFSESVVKKMQIPAEWNLVNMNCVDTLLDSTNEEPTK